ncbi:hypothetical protein J1614_004383 [Plenodomus biglobosus]|nr:hypothetical protein J1614_004383 [Plenodomus biglobosus]
MLTSRPRASNLSTDAGVDGWLFHGLKRGTTMLFDIDVCESAVYELPLPLPVSCAHVEVTEDWNMRRYWGIVLHTSNDTAGAFERVGVVSACCDWCEGAQIQEVVFV